jgi:hypothetical protein
VLAVNASTGLPRNDRHLIQSNQSAILQQKNPLHLQGIFQKNLFDKLQRLQNIIHTSYCFCAFVEEGLFFFIQSEVENLFPTITADHYGNAETNIALSIFAFEAYAAGE